MIIAIDAVGAKYGGAATVLKAVVMSALSCPDLDRIVVYTSPREKRFFNLPTSSRLVEVEVPYAEKGALGRLHWHWVGLASRLKRERARSVLCLSGAGLTRGACPAALFIQQSLPFVPEALAELPLAARARLEAIGLNMRLSARHADVVTVQTETMAAAVRKKFHLPDPGVRVMGAASTLQDRSHRVEELSELRKATLPLLYVGNTSPHKNLGVLAEGMGLLRRTLCDVTLFATVPPDHFLTKVPGVFALPPLAAGALFEAYSLAAAVVLPSLAETVGLPLLEAASVGTPAIVADRPYAREVCADGAVFFDPRLADDFARKAATLITDAGARNSFGRRAHENAVRRSEARPYDAMIGVVTELARSPGWDPK
jgi:glycosyltransferase involved in cell wall biosynthesis